MYILFIIISILPLRITANEPVFCLESGIGFVSNHSSKTYGGLSIPLQLSYREENKKLGFKYSNFFSKEGENFILKKRLRQFYSAFSINKSKAIFDNPTEKNYTYNFKILLEYDQISLNKKNDILNIGILLSSRVLGDILKFSLLFNKRKIGHELLAEKNILF